MTDIDTASRYKRQLARRDETIARLRRSLDAIQQRAEATLGFPLCKASGTWQIAERALTAKDDDYETL